MVSSAASTVAVRGRSLRAAAAHRARVPGLLVAQTDQRQCGREGRKRARRERGLRAADRDQAGRSERSGERRHRIQQPTHDVGARELVRRPAQGSAAGPSGRGDTASAPTSRRHSTRRRSRSERRRPAERRQSRASWRGHGPRPRARGRGDGGQPALRQMAPRWPREACVGPPRARPRQGRRRGRRPPRAPQSRPIRRPPPAEGELRPAQPHTAQVHGECTRVVDGRCVGKEDLAGRGWRATGRVLNLATAWPEFEPQGWP
jgi:hypothetical protein